jgi:uncharacterized protein (TIGR01440 family)
LSRNGFQAIITVAQRGERELDKVFEQARELMSTLLREADNLKKGDIVVIGCSTSSVAGKRIGSESSSDTAKSIMDAVLPLIKERELYLAVQCCEHLNRALVVERECLEKYSLTEVSVRPHLHAGGAFAVQAMERFDNYTMTEDLAGKASAGMDIGGTFIGMHLHPVVVPVHVENRHIGEANVTIARTRPKYIGGPRAEYPDFKKNH